MALSNRSSKLKSEAARKGRMASPWVQASALRTVVMTEARSRSPAARSAAAGEAGRAPAGGGVIGPGLEGIGEGGGEEESCDGVQGALLRLGDGHDDLDGAFDEIAGHVG